MHQVKVVRFGFVAVIANRVRLVVEVRIVSFLSLLVPILQKERLLLHIVGNIDRGAR